MALGRPAPARAVPTAASAGGDFNGVLDRRVVGKVLVVDVFDRDVVTARLEGDLGDGRVRHLLQLAVDGEVEVAAVGVFWTGRERAVDIDPDRDRLAGCD